MFAKDSFDNCEAICVQLGNDLWRGDHALIVSSGMIVPRRPHWNLADIPKCAELRKELPNSGLAGVVGQQVARQSVKKACFLEKQSDGIGNIHLQLRRSAFDLSHQR